MYDHMTNLGNFSSLSSTLQWQTTPTTWTTTTTTAAATAMTTTEVGRVGMGRGSRCVLSLGMLFFFFLFLTVLIIIITSYMYTKTTMDDYHQHHIVTTMMTDNHQCHVATASTWTRSKGQAGGQDMREGRRRGRHEKPPKRRWQWRSWAVGACFSFLSFFFFLLC